MSPTNNSHPSIVDSLKAQGNVEGLIKALGRQHDRRMRSAAAKALGDIGNSRAVEPLIAALGDEDAVTRSSVADALGRLGDARAVQPLIAALKDKDIELREDIADALARIGSIYTLKPLIARLKDKDPDMRFYAAKILGQIGDAYAVEPLIAALDDEDLSLRRNAAEALGQLGDARAVEPLIAALKDRDIMLHQYAAKAIVRIGSIHAVKPLIATLKDKDPAMRRYAAEILGQIGDTHAMEPLIAALEDEDKIVGKIAFEALVKIGDPRAIALVSKYKEMVSRSEDYAILCTVLHDNSTATGYIDFEHKYELDPKGFVNVLQAIEAILDEIRLNAEKGDAYSRYQIRRLVDLLEELAHLEVMIGTHEYFYDQNPYYKEEHDCRYDCAEPVRARAQQALQEATGLVKSARHTGTTGKG